MPSAGADSYLNNAATSWPKAPGVIEAVRTALADPPRMPGRDSGSSQVVVSECRRALARRLGTDDPQRIVLTSGATAALNLAIAGAHRTGGFRILSTVTEHNSVLRPIRHLERDCADTEVTLVGLDRHGRVDPEEWLAALEQGPDLVALNHASNVTGQIQPAGELLAQAKDAGAITLLDSCQSMGLIPTPAPELSADIVVFTGHKALGGPPGIGGLYLRPGIELHQRVVGGTGRHSDRPFHPEKMPERLEAGTPNMPAIAGLLAALRWHETSPGAFSHHQGVHAKRLREALAATPGVRLFCPRDPEEWTGIVSFALEGWSVQETAHALEESFGIVSRAGLHCAPLIHQHIGSAPSGTVRLSPSGFNTVEDIDHALGAITKMTRCTSLV